MSEVFKSHSDKQEKAIFSDSNVLLVGCGTQWGKTKVGSIRMKTKIHTFTDKKDAFIITSPTYKTMMQSTLPPFLEIMKGMGHHNKQEQVFEIFGGGIVYLRTETDPDSIVGITDVKHIWGDEAGKYRLYFWENMQARADFCGCGIDLTTSPYALNWVYRELIRPKRKGERPDVDYIAAASWENPYHSLSDPDKRIAKRNTMDARRFDMLYGGEFAKMVGLVYDCFDEDENICPAFDLPSGTVFYGGVDWGYSHPFGMHIRGITPDGRHYQVSEFKKSGLTLPQIIEYAKQQKQTWNIQMFHCGPDRPENIELFNLNGLPAIGAENSVQKGIDLHYELIKTRKFKLFRGAHAYAQDEYETYHYPESKDLGPDEDAKEDEPVGQNDDLVDASRYCTIMTYRSGTKYTPKVAADPAVAVKNESNQKRIARLKKMNKNRHTERW